MKADTQLILVAAGAAAILLAIVWRFLARARQIHRLERALRGDGQPAERARAGNTIVELGLARASKSVLQMMPKEPDDRVRLSVALAVARRQWEPTRAKRVVQVRAWASEELEQHGRPVREFGPAVTRLADMGGPRNPNPPRRPNGANVQPEAPTAPTPVATLDPSPEPGTNADGNGNGNGNGADIIYRPEAAPTRARNQDGAIRWVAPTGSERTD
ncbi:MAG TPA: hypothetical protein VLV81_06570 [Acidimicrobiia bacterium]|nr:hypothetical protein [Acidimicrobiia bacterium]